MCKSNCPWGADVPEAPWNRTDAPEENFNVAITQVLVKETEIMTNDYKLIPGSENQDTDDTDWKNAYYNNDKYTPLDLINKFKELLEENIPDKKVNRKKHLLYKKLIKECDNWRVDDLNFERTGG